MYATVIDASFKPESRDEVISMMDGLMDDLNSKVAGLRGYFVLDRGDNNSTAVVLYETKEHWEAAASAGAEILGKLGPYMAAMPERSGCEVMAIKRFATD